MVATRFAVAVHILMLLAAEWGQDAARSTSSRIAQSVNTNPVVVRRITGQLARAGLIRVRRGPGGAELAQPPAQITLADVWEAVNPAQSRPLLPVHAKPDQACPIGRCVHSVLGEAFGQAERAMCQALTATTLQSLIDSADHIPPEPTIQPLHVALT